MLFFNPYIETRSVYVKLIRCICVAHAQLAANPFGLDHRFRWSYAYYVHLRIIPLVLECNHFGPLDLFLRMHFGLFYLYLRKS